MYKLISILTKQTNKINSADEIPLKFAHDKVRLNIKIGHKHSIIVIPHSFYQKIKRVLDLFLHVNFNVNKKTTNKQHSTLFVEFDPIKFSDFILESKKAHTEKIFFKILV